MVLLEKGFACLFTVEVLSNKPTVYLPDGGRNTAEIPFPFLSAAAIKADTFTGSHKLSQVISEPAVCLQV